MLLWLIVIAAACVRCWGIAFGLPHTLARPDEERVLGSAFNVARGDFNPGFFSYPSLYIYLSGSVEWLYYAAGRASGRFSSLDAFVASWPIDYRPLWLAGRLLTVLFGTAAVWLVYRLGSATYSRRSGLLAAFFLAFAFLHVRDSHFAVTDVPMTTLVVAACVLLVRATRLATVRGFALAGLVAGLATSTKYNAALFVAPALFALLLTPFGERGNQARLRAAAAFILCMLAAFLAGTPYAILDHRQFSTDLAFEAAHLRAGHAIALGRGWAYHAAVSLPYGLGLPVLCSGLVGVVVAFARSPRAAAVVFSFPLAYYAVAGGSFTVFTRYMTPVVPFVCVGAGVLVDEVVRRLAALAPGRTARLLADGTAAVAAVVMVWPSAAAAFAADRLLAKTDTRVLAARWIVSSVPAGSSIYQSGVHYGHAQLETGGRPLRYRSWSWDDARRTFVDRTGRPTGESPQWIVIQRSPLTAYSAVPSAVDEVLASNYIQVATFSGTRDSANLIYDQQDAFYLPMRGFEAVTRPGPNLYVYQRRGP